MRAYMPAFRSIFLMLLGLVFSTQALASPVFKISKGDNYFYLGGTIHLLSKNDYPLPSAFQSAFDDTTTLVLETDLSHMSSSTMQHILKKEFFYPQHHTVKHYVSSDTYRRLSKSVTKMGLNLEQLARLRAGPMMAQIVVFKLKLIGIGDKGVDTHFLELAQSKKSHQLAYLEPLEMQMKVLASLGKGDEDRYLALALDDLDRVDTMFRQMVREWRNWDESALDQNSLAPMREGFKPAYKALVIDRNNRWMGSLETFAQTQERELVLVGALHLVGPDGLLTKLKARGYTVTQMH